MNFNLKGDFKIDDSWKKDKARENLNPKPKSRSKSREKSNHSLAQAGRNIIADHPIPDALDDHVSKFILREFQAEIPPPPSVKSIRSEKRIPHKDQNMPPMKPRSNLPGQDGDLLGSMANRLKTIETNNRSLKEELKVPFYLL